MLKTSSLKFVRNVSARGSTMKYANAMPPANRSVADAAKIDTIRCVCSSTAGARKDHSW